MARHRAGRFDEAHAAYARAHEMAPTDADILHMLGIVSCQLGRREEGIAQLAAATALKPNHAEAQCNFGQALLDAGRLEEAVGAFSRALAAKPDLGAAYDRRGMALQRLGMFRDALDDHVRACALIPGSAPAWSNLAATHIALKNFGPAEEACRRALAIDPGLPMARNNLGLSLAGLNRVDEAEAALSDAAASDPASEALYNHGCVLCDAGRPADAIGFLTRAITARPDFAPAHNNLGNALRALNRVHEAEEAYRRALALDPQSAEAHFNLALALLVDGRLVPGWEEYEWRWTIKNTASVGVRRPGPRWLGHPLRGQTLLVHAEQGLGDTIQFLRYLPRVAASGARVVLEVQDGLAPLLEGFPGVDRVIVRGEECRYDLHCPLLSLPRVFQTTLETVPAATPYLRADPARAAVWKERLAARGVPRIGLAWAGSPDNRNDRNRSMGLEMLGSLLERRDVAWVSLQKGRAEAAARANLHDVAPHLTDFAETAAAIANLDLVITVDTSVAHLAGAMGKPVWVLLPFAPDWRWLLDRTDSPWYPTMRLFRQRSPGDWPEAVARVEEAVAELLSGRR